MSESAVRTLLLERVEEWRFAQIERIEQGHTEQTYRLSLGGRRALFKYDPSSRSIFVNSRHDEAEIQRTAAARGLAPNVYYVDDDCILTEYIDGKVLSDPDFHDPDTLFALGKRLRAVHDLPLTGRRFNAIKAADSYAERIADQSMAARCIAAIEAIPRNDDALTFCHNDLAAGNIIRSDAYVFIDWEYACDNHPLFDIATLIAHHGLSRVETCILTEAYFETSDTWVLATLALYERAYHALHWLWLANRDPGNWRLSELAAEVAS